jgi:hypothetical protein
MIRELGKREKYSRKSTESKGLKVRNFRAHYAEPSVCY